MSLRFSLSSSRRVSSLHSQLRSRTRSSGFRHQQNVLSPTGGYASRPSSFAVAAPAVPVRCMSYATTTPGRYQKNTGGRNSRNSAWREQQQRRQYTPMTATQEEEEKKRVENLSAFQKDQELRKLNREIAKLEKLRGINTGELYTWSGQYKALARDYGMPLFVWYWAVWTTTAVCCYGAITIFDIDTLALIGQVDNWLGWNMQSRVDPEMGKIGMAIVANEVVEPVRLPFVIVTVKPVMDRVFPPKY